MYIKIFLNFKHISFQGDGNLDNKVTDLATNSQLTPLDKTKSEYLRKTYGDTCLQVHTKKCYDVSFLFEYIFIIKIIK